MRNSTFVDRRIRRRFAPALAIAFLAGLALLVPDSGHARGGARVSGGGGGHMATSSVVGENRSVTRTASDGNINRNTNVQTNHGDVNRNTNVNTNTGTVNRNTNVNSDYGNVNRNANVNVNNGNVNVNRDVDIDVNHGWYDNHPVATAAAVGTAVAVTAAAVGSIVYSLPPSCSAVVENGVQYNYCGGVYYQPMYSGSTVTYVVVNP